MSKKVWLITGAGRGMGVGFAGAALASGHAVVASGRDRERVATVLGASSDLLAVTLDVTSAADAEAAVRAAVDRFGRIDVLVNNAASFYAGYFEELTPQQIGQHLAAGLLGPMNVTRAVLPVMRRQRSGHIVSISSSAGLSGFEFNSAYAASKFGPRGLVLPRGQCRGLRVGRPYRRRTAPRCLRSQEVNRTVFLPGGRMGLSPPPYVLRGGTTTWP